MFLTDDSIFYKEVKLPEGSVEPLLSNPKKYSLSLRLGLNYKIKPVYEALNDNYVFDFYCNNFLILDE